MHNCTTYAAYRLQQNGYGYPGWTDNANGWDTGAWNANPRVQVDQTPAVGSIAQWNGGPAGHVAYVEAVTNDYIETTSDSAGGGTDRIRIARASPYMPDNFIHFKDQTSSAPKTRSDFDGDGKADLAYFNAGAGFAVARGTASGFSEAGRFLTNWGTPDWAGVGDFDGDGKADVAFFNTGAGVAVARGTASGFSEAGRFLTNWAKPTWGGVGDFDGDGKADVAFFDAGAGFAVARGTASGFSETGRFLTNWGTPDWAGVGDFDGDGKDDILFFNAGAGFALARGTASGLSEAGRFLTNWAKPTWGGVGDFDGDGKADVAFFDAGAGFALARGTASGFSEAGRFLTNWGTPDWAGVGDFDGDGKADVAFFNTGAGVAVARGTASGFSEAGRFLTNWGTPVWGSGGGSYPGQVGDGWAASTSPAPTAPGAPRSVLAVAGAGSAGVSWLAPSSDGGWPVLDYTVIASPGGVSKTVSGLSASFSGLTPGVAYTFSVSARSAVGSGPAAVSAAVVPTSSGDPNPVPPTIPAPAGGAAFLSLVPARLLDTRPGYQTVDGLFAGVGVRAAGSVTEVTVTGRGGVPGDASAVALHVTVVSPAGPGFVTVFPCGASRPNAANLNYVAWDVIANAVLAKVGDGGKVCVFSSAATQLVVDVNGAVTGTAEYAATVPARLMDTRPVAATVDGQFSAIGARPAGSVTELQVTGRAGVPADASAVVINLTVTETQAPGFVTVYPCGSTRPTAANLNYVAGQTIPNLVIAKVGAGGTVCIYTYAGTQLVADLNGYMPAGSSYQPLVPARLLDSRAGYTTVDGLTNGIGARPAGSVTELQVAGRGGVPSTVGAVVLNVTVTEPAGPGFITVYPCGSTRPTAANLNYTAGQTIPNLVIAKVDSTGKACIYTYAATHLIADINGNFPNAT